MKKHFLEPKMAAAFILVAIIAYLVGMFVGMDRANKSNFKASTPLIYCTGATLLPDDKYYQCVDEVRGWDLEKMYQEQN
jgi:uncharacterized membrane protein YhiD involved in acid resistance